MKKLMLAFAVTCLLSMTSCVKHWTCECVTDGSSVTDTPINGGTFIHAHHSCQAMAKGSTNCSLLTDNK